MLYPIIKRVSAETGIDLVQDRVVLVDYFNAACRVFHGELEANKMFREVTLVVPPDKIISLPSFIGEIRGIRIHSSEQLVPLHMMNTPRYSNSTLAYRVKNWRDLGDSPVQCNLTNVGPLTLTCSNVEATPVTVQIAGQTSSASKLEESILVNATTVTTVNQFGPTIFSIACFGDRNNDITISDSQGNVLAVLGNKDSKTRYKLMDVSQIYWPTSDTSAGNFFADILYKLPFVNCKNDTDSFAGGDDYDEAIYNMMMHLNFAAQGGKDQQANAALGRAMQLLKAAKDGSEEGVHKKLQWGRNKFYDLFKKGRHMRHMGYVSDSTDC